MGNELIVIGGATASGKTDLAISLARLFDAEILSADSRQFYREMSIGTAKPSDEQLSAAKHHFIGHLSIHNTYSVGDFERDALDTLNHLFAANKLVFLAGGSGLYIKAVTHGLDEFPEVTDEIKQEVQDLLNEQGIGALQQELEYHDPVYYQQVDLQNPARLLRALAVCRQSGQPFSSFRTGNPKPRNFRATYIAYDWPRADLYERINERVEQMFESGIIDEARSLYPFRDLKALQTVGYQELFDSFDGLVSMDQAKELIKRNTRRYAKRQMTWMRKNGDWKWFQPGDVEEVAEYIAGLSD